MINLNRKRGNIMKTEIIGALKCTGKGMLKAVNLQNIVSCLKVGKDELYGTVDNGNKAKERLYSMGIEPKSTSILDGYADMKTFRTIADASLSPRTDDAGNIVGYDFNTVVLRNAIALKGYGTKIKSDTYFFDTIRKKPGDYKFVIYKTDNEGRPITSRIFTLAISRGEAYWISSTNN